MNALAVAFLTFVCLFGSAVLGMFIRRRLPEEHLRDDSKHLLEVSLGIIGTMSGLVLGLLVASATASYNAQRNELQDASSKIILLDRVLANYGPDARRARATLYLTVEGALARIWPQEHTRTANSGFSSLPSAGQILDATLDLAPKTDDQRFLREQALRIVIELGQLRWLMSEQGESSISVPLLILLIFWFAITFLGFGLLAPANATVLSALGLCALAVSGAIFVMLEMYTPFSGLLQIPSTSLRDALAHLGQ